MFKSEYILRDTTVQKQRESETRLKYPRLSKVIRNYSWTGCINQTFRAQSLVAKCD